MSRYLNGTLIDIYAFFIILISVIFRFYNLDSQSLWSDELFSIVSALDVGPNVHWYYIVPKVIPELSYQDSFLTWKAADNTPPLFEFILIIWAKIFGSSDFALRSLPAVIGSLIPAMFYIGTNKVFGKIPSLFGVVFLAFSPALLVYSQEVRSYILASFFSTISIVWLAKGVSIYSNEIDEINNWFVWGGVLILLFLSYSHYTGLITAGLIATIYLLMFSLPRKKIGDIFRFLTVPLLVLPWIYLSYKAFVYSGSGALGWREYGVDYIPIMITRTLGFYFLYLYNIAGWSILVMFLAAICVIFWEKKQGKRVVELGVSSPVKLYLAVLLGVSFIFFFCYSIYVAFTAKMWHPRYFVVFSPIIALIICLLCSILFKNKKYIFIIQVLFTIVMFKVAIDYTRSPGEKANYRGGAEYIAEHISPDSDVLLGWKPNSAYYLHYLGKMIKKSIEYETFPVSYEKDVISYCQDLQNSRVKLKKIFVYQNIAQLPYYKWLSNCKNIKEVGSVHLGRDPLNDIVVYEYFFERD